MSDEAQIWLQYARENLQVAEMSLEAGLLNPCLQNAQQSVEKALKAIRVHRDIPPRRTHSIRDLNRDLTTLGIMTVLTDDECELLDSIYIGSKYPLDSVFPDSVPDVAVCRQCVALAKQTLTMAEKIVRI